MNKVFSILMGMFLMLTVFANNVQAEGEYFLGKWNIMVMGTPNGDSPMKAEVVKKDGKIVVLMQSEEGGELKPVDRFEISDTELTAYWVAGGYNVYLFLEKVDEDNVEGSLMDMFDATGERAKE
ncbi:hypothetical protein [Mangrovibacterium diazotrophicum]|uniref:Uncharacterized protein n=1 Tax=Mangrovibacterium diazotrophicum TaxID=1261403 RepID=A0A419W600_9BACT|nr:hypothetical protein [Mangrovibacterium diazotrophicum]RKD90866.1 hypothetical protein BC643_1211 [Mangrovibacterium diazotrophicum]